VKSCTTARFREMFADIPKPIQEQTRKAYRQFKEDPRDLHGNNIPIDRRAQALRPYSNGFCPQCRGELRSKAQVPKLSQLAIQESPSTAAHLFCTHQ